MIIINTEYKVTSMAKSGFYVAEFSTLLPPKAISEIRDLVYYPGTSRTVAGIMEFWLKRNTWTKGCEV